MGLFYAYTIEIYSCHHFEVFSVVCSCSKLFRQQLAEDGMEVLAYMTFENELKTNIHKNIITFIERFARYVPAGYAHVGCVSPLLLSTYLTSIFSFQRLKLLAEDPKQRAHLTPGKYRPSLQFLCSLRHTIGKLK